MEPLQDQVVREHFAEVLADFEGQAEASRAEKVLAGSSKEVLARLVESDPLAVREAGVKCIDDEGLLLDPNRLFLRSVAVIAYRAPEFDQTDLCEWISQQVLAAVTQLLEDDWEESGEGLPVLEPKHYAWVSDALQVDSEKAREMCVAYNRLPRRVRRAFYATMVIKMSLHRYVALGYGPPSRVRADIERALRTLAELEDPGPLGEEAR